MKVEIPRLVVGGASDDAKQMFCLCSHEAVCTPTYELPTSVVCSSKQQSTEMERQHMQKICKAWKLSMRASMAMAYCGEVAGSTGGGRQ